MATYEHQKNDFRCTYEDIPEPSKNEQGKLRILSVEGKVVRSSKKVQRDGTPDPLIGSLKQYLSDSPKLQQIGFEKGHVIALDLGGPNINYNIAPMLSWFNQVEYRKLERALREDSDAKWVKIRISYCDDPGSQAIPTSFWVYVKAKPNGDWSPFDILDMKAPTPDLYPFDENVRSAVEKILPAEKPKFEPYGFLETLKLLAPSDTSDFTELQRTYILTANALYDLKAGGKGFLRSDDPTDLFKTLSLNGGNDRPEVDHIIPRSWGGSNSFHNAQVLSKCWNNQKRDKMTNEKKAILLASKDPRPRRTKARYNPYEK